MQKEIMQKVSEELSKKDITKQIESKV